MRNYFTFGEYDSRDFGVFIARDGVYNAPRRVYRQVQIPGRNGELLMDEGRYENILVDYPCLIYSQFNANIEGLRNALLSSKGYIRITNSYHPDEYRLGCYMDEFLVSPRVLGDGGTFDVVFNCKPQRFLTAGESPVSFEKENIMPYPYSGRTTGAMVWNDLGDGTVTVSGVNYYTAAYFYFFENAALSLTDGKAYTISGAIQGQVNIQLIQSVDGTDTTYTDTGGGVTFTHQDGATYTCAAVVPFRVSISQTTSVTPMLTEGTGGIEVENPTPFPAKPLIRVEGTGTVGIGEDTITIASGFEYIDIDSEIQDCYCGTQNANSAVTFSNDKFPELQPGINGVEISDTITNLEIIPRWYIL